MYTRVNSSVGRLKVEDGRDYASWLMHDDPDLLFL